MDLFVPGCCPVTSTEILGTFGPQDQSKNMGNIFPKHEGNVGSMLGSVTVVQLHSELTNLSGHFESVHSQDVAISDISFHLQCCTKRCLFGVSLQVIRGDFQLIKGPSWITA